MTGGIGGMRFRYVLGALFKLGNIGVLLLLLGASALLSSQALFPSLFQLTPEINIGDIAYPASIAIYIALVLKTLASGKYREEFNHKEKIRHIQDLNYMCLKLANEAKKHTNNTYYQKLRKVMEDKNDIVNSFFRGERSFLKEKIVEQTLNLVVSYIKLLTNFCIRSRELNTVDVGEITNRINVNMRRLNFANDPAAAEDIKKVIEMDEKLLNRLKEEKRDLERISAKLDYMETTVNMFKHQILSSVETEDMLEKLETAVNEATALDNVLEERRKNKMNLR